MKVKFVLLLAVLALVLTTVTPMSEGPGPELTIQDNTIDSEGPGPELTNLDNTIDSEGPGPELT